MNKGFQRATFSESTAAQHQVLPAPQDQVPPLPAGSRYRVRGGFLTAAGNQDLVIESASTTLGPANLSDSSPLVMEPLGGGIGEVWFECAVDEVLNITLGQAVQTDGVLFYDVV